MSAQFPSAPIEPLAYAASGTPQRPGILTTLGVISIVLGSMQLLFNGIVVIIALTTLLQLLRRTPGLKIHYPGDQFQLYCIDSGVCLLLSIALIGCGIATLTTARHARSANQIYGVGRLVVTLIFALIYGFLGKGQEIVIFHLPAVAYGFILLVAMRAGTVRRYYESAMAY